MKKRLLALLLALSLSLSLAACTNSNDPAGTHDQSPSGGEIQSAAPSEEPSPSIEADLSQDILAFSAGLSADEPMLTVNGDVVPADLFLYWLFYNCSYFESIYTVYYGIPLADYVDMMLDDTITMAQSYTLLKQKAAEMGCPLTDEQIAEAQASLAMEDSDITYDQLKTLYGLTDSSMEYIATINYYYDNLLAAWPTPTEEELNNYAYQVKHILLATIDLTTGAALDEETIAAQRALAEDILSQLQEVEREEQEALFDQLMEQFSEDGRDSDGHIAASDGYEFTVESSLVDGFTDAALALAPGEISGIVETAYGYHIMLRGELEFREATRDEYAAECKAYLFSRAVTAWTEEADIVRSDALNDLDVLDFYTRYTIWFTAMMDTMPEIG